jgi:hypothetical protein
VERSVGSIIYASVSYCDMVWNEDTVNYLVTKFLVKTVGCVPV